MSVIDGLREREQALREKMTARQERLFDAFVFLGLFTLLAAPLYVVVALGWTGTPVRGWTATVSAVLLDAAGIPASSTGPYLAAGELLVDVTRDSTGWKSLLAFAALVVASRPARRAMVEGIVLGIVTVAAANVLRIVSMVVLVQRFGVPYDLLHTVLWRWGMTAIVLGLWVVWWRYPAPVTSTRSLIRSWL